MSSHYNTEPPPTASVILHTTAGPLQLSLFAKQAPLTCQNFLQHILDGYYDSTIFHRVVSGFVIQGGDPTGTGDGGQSIFEDREFEIDPKTGEKVVFGDEIHTRLKFNRRGLVGMAKMDESSYGSQFFITLADVRAQLDGNCTMFGRVEGEGIYNVNKIAEAELVEGTERPMYPFQIKSAEILEIPKGEPWEGMKKRERIAKRSASEPEAEKPKKKAKTGKKGKAILSFGGDEMDTDEGLPIKLKPKFDTSLISATEAEKSTAKPAKSKKLPKEARKHTTEAASPTKSIPNGKRPHSPPPLTAQLPIPNLEASPSPPPPPKSPIDIDIEAPSKTSLLQAEIASLKSSMRRTTTSTAAPLRPKTALESLIPSTSIRGRKRPRPGDKSDKNDKKGLEILGKFRERLEAADHAAAAVEGPEGPEAAEAGVGDNIERSEKKGEKNHKKDADKDDDEEAALCDLHFIINCASCSQWDPSSSSNALAADGENATTPADNEKDTPLLSGISWMAHSLSFEKDRLGKDLEWKRKNEKELVVIDPREREREMGIGEGKGKTKEKGKGKWK